MPLFNRGKKELGRKSWVGSTIKVALMRDTFVPNIDTQDLWGDVSASEIPLVTNYVAGGLALANKTLVQNNSADRSEYKADTASFGALGIGASIGWAIVYIHHASDANERHLLGYFDLRVGGNGVATNGANITLPWSGGIVFSLSHVAGAHVWYNRGKARCGLANWETQTYRLALMKGGASPYVPDLDLHQVWGDISASECAIGAPYVAGGATLSPDGNRAVVEDDTNDRAEFKASDVPFGALPAAPSDPMRFAALYEHHASDANERHLWALFDLRQGGQDVPTNGTGVTIKFPSLVALRMQHVA